MIARPLLAVLFVLVVDTGMSAAPLTLNPSPSKGREEKEPKRPNILWLICEDMSCHLGCYGDKDAITPHLDALAKQSVRYTNAFSGAPVCAPSRSTLILGMYASTVGSHYMRCQAPLPKEIRGFPVYLREAGYYCTNNVKEDYNLQKPPGFWDVSSNKAHYRDRKKGQPFFAVFNNTVTHESQNRAAKAQYEKNTSRLTDKERHDPKKIAIPPFHPDTAEVRKDWAQHFDLITAMDKWVGDHLESLEKAGLADDTIVFFYSDHGVGLPRGKRWLYDTGWKVPLLIRFGKNFAHLAPKARSTSDRLVSFVDFGPTALSLSGAKIPDHMQGIPFLGEKAGKPREAVYGIRDRMDERNDCTRAVRDKRYKYIRNYHPYKPWAQTLEYMELMPTMRSWRKLASEGKLKGAPALWMRPTKPFEELYDTESDPHELVNLAGEKKHQQTLERLRKLHLNWHRETRDLALMPEALVYERSKGRTPYELGKDDKSYPREKLLAAAETFQEKDNQEKLLKLIADDDPAIRWWGATGLGLLGGKQADEALTKALKDKSAVVRVAAGDGLRRLGKGDVALPVLIEALSDENPWVRHESALALDEMGAKAAKAKESLTKALKDDNSYVVRVVRNTLKTIEGEK